MHSILLVIIPKDTANIADKISELLSPFMKPEVEDFEAEYLQQLLVRYQLSEDNLDDLVEIIKQDLLIPPLGQIEHDGKDVYRIIDKHPSFIPDSWRIGGIWYGLIRKSYKPKDLRPHSIETQIEENSLVVYQLEDEFLESVMNVLLPDGKLICYWDYDRSHISPGLFFTNHMHLMPDLQAAKAKVKNDYSDYLAVTVDVHT